MRQYSNYLLFEGLLDGPPSTSPAIGGLLSTLTTPSVLMSMTDCGTQLGGAMGMDYDVDGFVEIATGSPFNQARIDTLLSSGVTTTFVRSIQSCTSKTGVCQACFEGSFPNSAIPAIGQFASVPSTYVSTLDVLLGNNTTVAFQLTPTPYTVVSTLVYHEGSQVSGSLYSISGGVITFTAPIPYPNRYAVRQYITTTDGLLNYFSNTYSSSLMGLASIPGFPLPLSEGKMDSLISIGVLQASLNELTPLPIPSTMLDYYKRISSNLEAALYIIYLYILYNAVIR